MMIDSPSYNLTIDNLRCRFPTDYAVFEILVAAFSKKQFSYSIFETPPGSNVFRVIVEKPQLDGIFEIPNQCLTLKFQSATTIPYRLEKCFEQLCKLSELLNEEIHVGEITVFNRENLDGENVAGISYSYVLEYGRFCDYPPALIENVFYQVMHIATRIEESLWQIREGAQVSDIWWDLKKPTEYLVPVEEDARSHLRQAVRQAIESQHLQITDLPFGVIMKIKGLHYDDNTFCYKLGITEFNQVFCEVEPRSCITMNQKEQVCTFINNIKIPFFLNVFTGECLYRKGYNLAGCEELVSSEFILTLLEESACLAEAAFIGLQSVAQGGLISQAIDQFNSKIGSLFKNNTKAAEKVCPVTMGGKLADSASDPLSEVDRVENGDKVFVLGPPTDVIQQQKELFKYFQSIEDRKLAQEVRTHEKYTQALTKADFYAQMSNQYSDLLTERNDLRIKIVDDGIEWRFDFFNSEKAQIRPGDPVERFNQARSLVQSELRFLAIEFEDWQNNKKNSLTRMLPVFFVIIMIIVSAGFINQTIVWIIFLVAALFFFMFWIADR